MNFLLAVPDSTTIFFRYRHKPGCNSKPAFPLSIFHSADRRLEIICFAVLTFHNIDFSTVSILNNRILYHHIIIQRCYFGYFRSRNLLYRNSRRRCLYRLTFNLLLDTIHYMHRINSYFGGTFFQCRYFTILINMQDIFLAFLYLITKTNCIRLLHLGNLNV